jgi:hypothetical protein
MGVCPCYEIDQSPQAPSPRVTNAAGSKLNFARAREPLLLVDEEVEAVDVPVEIRVLGLEPVDELALAKSAGAGLRVSASLVQVAP